MCFALHCTYTAVVCIIGDKQLALTCFFLGSFVLTVLELTLVHFDDQWPVWLIEQLTSDSHVTRDPVHWTFREHSLYVFTANETFGLIVHVCSKTKCIVSVVGNSKAQTSKFLTDNCNITHRLIGRRKWKKRVYKRFFPSGRQVTCRYLWPVWPISNWWPI